MTDQSSTALEGANGPELVVVILAPALSILILDFLSVCLFQGCLFEPS